MAIFDGVRNLIQAPVDKGVYEEENLNLIIPLPVGKALRKDQKELEEVTLPIKSKTEEEIEVDDEILKEDYFFPESYNNTAPIKENTDLPINKDLTIEVEENIFTPLGLSIKEIEEIINLPKSDEQVKVLDPELSTPKGIDVVEVKEDSKDLPTDATVLPNIPAEGTLINIPKDANLGITYETDEFIGREGVVIRPKGINYSDTIADRLFTKLTSVLDYIRVPVPESVKGLYSKIQEIEGYLSDPKSFAIQLKERTLGLLLGSNGGDKFNPSIGVVLIPKDTRNNLVYGVGQYRTGGTKKDLERNNELAGIYAGQNELTEGYVNDERAKEISDDIIESQFAFQGRKSTVGVTLRLNHLWDLKFEPYNTSKIKCVLPDMGKNISTAYEISRNKLSSEDYIEEGLRAEVYAGSDIPSDWEDSMPVLSYDLDYLALASKDVELYGGSTISVPEIIRQNSLLTTQILDDENKRWRRWFQKAISRMCPYPGVVIPYKNCCMIATLYQYRTDSHILSHKKLIVILKNYQVTSSGAGGGAGTPDVIDVEWSIVGEIKLYGDEPEKVYNSRAQKNKDYPADNGIDKIERSQGQRSYINIV